MHWDTKMALETQSSGWPTNFNLSWTPGLKLIRQIPTTIPYRQIEEAVKLFSEEVDVKGDKVGFINQTLESIAASTLLRKEGSGCDFWVVEDEEGLKGYVLSNIAKDVDNRLCYWISQAWLHKDYRGTGKVKDYWNTLKDYAIENFCKHIMIVSGRGDKAYQRLLGKSLHIYAHVYKEDI